MRPLTIVEAASAVVGLPQEIQRSEESHFDHRLHGVLLVAQGMTCPAVAPLLGDAPRTVEYGVHHFAQKGLAGLQEGERPGRPSRLRAEQIREVNRVLRAKPSEAGRRVNWWDGKTLAAWIGQQYSIRVGVRPCPRWFGHFDFRLRQPRPVLAKANETPQRTHTKNSKR